MNMVVVNIPSFICPLSDLRAVPKAVILRSFGYFLLYLLCILYLTYKSLLSMRRLTRGQEWLALQSITRRASHRNYASQSTISQRIV